MKIKGFKDITGQEFIAEVLDNNGSFVTIKNPLCLVPTEKGMMPIPYVMSTQDNLVINKSNLLFEPFNVVDNIENFYKEKFGGIVQPPSNLIL
jgi:hypothetical protein